MQTLESPLVTPERPQLFERESVMVNEPDFRPSVGSVFNEERQQQETVNKRMITYFTVFALSEYLFLFVLQGYFYLRKSRLFLAPRCPRKRRAQPEVLRQPKYEEFLNIEAQ